MQRKDTADFEAILTEFADRYRGHYSCATYPAKRHIVISLLAGDMPERHDFSSFVEWAGDRSITVEFLSSEARGPQRTAR